MSPKTVGLIVFEGMAAADLTGPAEAFSRAKPPTDDPRERCYQLLTLGIDAAPCVTECGIIVKPRLDLEDAPSLDTIFVSGGSGIHNHKLSKTIAKWLLRRVPEGRRVAALGSGIYPLAATGLRACVLGAQSSESRNHLGAPSRNCRTYFLTGKSITRIPLPLQGRVIRLRQIWSFAKPNKIQVETNDKKRAN